jgi:hypothetical protein
MRRLTSFSAAIVGIAAFSFLSAMRPGPSAFAVPDNRDPTAKAVEDILREIQAFPPAKESEAAALKSLRSSDMPVLAKEKLAEYADDGCNPFAKKLDAESLQKERAKHPLRVAAFEAAPKIRETMDLRMPEFLKREDGLAEGARKNFLAQQKEPALAILDLEEMLDDMKKLDEQRDDEKSKRWRAHFDLAKARLISRLIYINEYNNLIAQIRTDSLPALEEKIHVGWRVTASDSVQNNEVKVRTMAKYVAKLWTQIEKDYPGTPWAFVAGREKNVARGLAWVPTR